MNLYLKKKKIQYKDCLKRLSERRVNRFFFRTLLIKTEPIDEDKNDVQCLSVLVVQKGS